MKRSKRRASFSEADNDEDDGELPLKVQRRSPRGFKLIEETSSIFTHLRMEPSVSVKGFGKTADVPISTYIVSGAEVVQAVSEVFPSSIFGLYKGIPSPLDLFICV